MSNKTSERRNAILLYLDENGPTKQKTLEKFGSRVTINNDLEYMKSLEVIEIEKVGTYKFIAKRGDERLKALLSAIGR